ncbi:hypothetical protein EXS74_03260 [Candidatus Woesearchaeota archaeon]|nr:hypothetical protein [Candidatus Woesearchaeota archaeon]
MIKCEDCRAECCREVCVEMDAPETIEDWDILRWMVAHENVAVYIDDEDAWLVEFKTKCRKLNDQNRCTIYKTRPKICSEHPVDNCVVNADEPAEKLRFDTLEQVEKHIEEVIKPKLLKESQKQLEDLDKWKFS